ncbi:class I adenylate cyclase [Candidatus Hartigia pinicola]
MYLYIETIKQRLDAINQLRLDRGMSSMSEAFCKVYNLLPVLLHYHHPMMPGYIEENVLHGVCFFTPDCIQKSWLAQFEKYLPYQPKFNGELPITGIYSMGSTSSVGQSQSSDLDIWICHPPWLDNEEKHLLKRKCTLLEIWATSFGIDMNIFLIDENRFRQKSSGHVSENDCGSTQHILLLDEFYRTAVRMAGKRLLWTIVPVEEERNYDEYVIMLYTQGVLTPNEWLDLGGLGELSAAEYFGASLWQLYKSVDSPYKSVLKSLLLESYSWRYPVKKTLALEFKHYLHAGENVCYGLDSYCLMLEFITRYLIEINDTTRLDLIRRCFYLKICEKSSQNLKKECLCWRKNILYQFVESWGWDSERLAILNAHNQWKIEEVHTAHDEFLDTMMRSYHDLIRFTHRNNLSVSASSQDIGVLTGKLYEAFEVFPDKMILVNPKMSPNISE